jgi:hypothetical protein
MKDVYIYYALEIGLARPRRQARSYICTQARRAEKSVYHQLLTRAHYKPLVVIFHLLVMQGVISKPIHAVCLTRMAFDPWKNTYSTTKTLQENSIRSAESAKKTYIQCCYPIITCFVPTPPMV